VTHLVDDPQRFADDAMRGFAEAYPQLVRAVEGGVVRAFPGPPGKTAVVVGGGSGHYPAFAGFVGPGFADGAVAGHVFTSPSVGRIYSVAKAADRGGGVLLACGNYAGDELNFSLAAERLNADGVATRLLLVSDDIASAPEAESDRRRGIAGGFIVFKLASAAAEANADLATVHQIATAANAATRTLGVAFAGCTLPGASSPLFEVPAGRMATGLGIHGEPGISEDHLPTAARLAQTLVDATVGEVDGDGRSAAVVLNGLGATKSEELFVLWHGVVTELRRRGIRLVAPEVRELVTSLDMAGCSLSLTWLDDARVDLWTAPCRTPAFVRFEHADVEPVDHLAVRRAERAIETERSARDRAVVELAVLALDAVADALQRAETELGQLDAVAGDGDHGTAMVRGSTAALAAARSSGSALRGTLEAAATAWGESAGGTSGVLWGRAIEAFAADADGDAAALARAARAAVDAVGALGKAVVGDKTMLDAMEPFARALAARVDDGDSLGKALDAAASAAEDGARTTSALRPRVGRARPLADRSVGSADPGATSFALVARVLADTFADR
jgi:dihydroxyacetone kinase